MCASTSPLLTASLFAHAAGQQELSAGPSIPAPLCSKAELPVEGGRFADGDFLQMSGDRL